MRRNWHENDCAGDRVVSKYAGGVTDGSPGSAATRPNPGSRPPPLFSIPEEPQSVRHTHASEFSLRHQLLRPLSGNAVNDFSSGIIEVSRKRRASQRKRDVNSLHRLLRFVPEHVYPVCDLTIGRKPTSRLRSDARRCVGIECLTDGRFAVASTAAGCFDRGLSLIESNLENRSRRSLSESGTCFCQVFPGSSASRPTPGYHL
jgi:hypothetical protein